MSNLRRSTPTKRRTPMKRSGFARPVLARTARSLPGKPARFLLPTPVTNVVISVPKENVVYSEPYRRLVAALPCSKCHIDGYSQAAHPPPTGKGRKEDDRETFPLCSTRPDEPGCHVEFDQYETMPSEEMREQASIWGAQTRARIIADDNWPDGLPMIEDEDTVRMLRSTMRRDPFEATAALQP